MRISTLREVWDYRELLLQLTLRNLKVKYKRSFLGFVWTLLNPLLTVGTLVAIFGYVVRIDVSEYWAFLVSGYFVWNFTSMVLTAGTKVLGEHAALARSVRIPEHVFVLSVVCSRLFEFFVEISLCIAAIVLFRHGGVPPAYAVIPFLIVCQVLLATGLTLPIAALAAFYDDVQHGLPVVLLILFYLTPVFYPMSLVPADVRDFFLINPIAQLITAYHTVLYEGLVPPIGGLLLLGTVSSAICGLGFMLFNQRRALLAEVL